MLEIEKPKIECVERTDDNCYAKFVVEPLERGYGITLGNSLRRILLSSLPGTAVTSVKIEGVLHEFSTVPGVLEDVTDIILNIKSLALKGHTDEPKILRLEAEGEGVVRAGDIITDADIEILNPDLKIATLDKDGRLFMEMTAERGRGYVSAEKNKKPDQTPNDRERNDRLNKSETPREKKLPGEYPANEDIMNRMNTRRVGMDVENFSRMIGTENLNMNEPVVTPPDNIEDDPALGGEDLEDRRDHFAMEHPVPTNVDNEDLDVQENNESDVTEDDFQALGPKDLSMDMGEDEQILKNRVWPVDMAGRDLDVPGSEGAGDIQDEAIGPEDEENDFYSLGGDRHEDDMEGK